MSPEDGDCTIEIKRYLLLWRKAVTNPDSVLKNKDIILPIKFHIVKAMFISVAMWMWEFDHKEFLSIEEMMPWNCDAGEVLRVSWTEKRSSSQY